ncbi:hypothetical protein [Clostridium beijerinckii]|uniref:Uncharacterized protein n=1 Tax=Clostridium beijerinckii TaxID=1520 RepID=A0AAX0AYK7_CLOBE|nr:hypothetical protein [Clostridium beijerinckii]NRT88135.1 hypothetical protein [Clostridium beijerinckii]NYC73563.1 hypothetical protein [Clostridium beijerinckii]
MVYKFLIELKAKTTDEQFKDILAATDQDIKFNRIGFGKTTGPKKFIEICTSCASIILKIDKEKSQRTPTKVVQMA